MSQPEAANQALRELEKSKDYGQRRPLQELRPQQVHNVLQGQVHSKLDRVDDRPVTRKHALQKIALSKLDLPDRQRYIYELLELDEDKHVIITCDETPLQFGGSGHPSHVSAPLRDSMFEDSKDPRFTRMQWGAASGDTRALRPVVLWKPESDEVTAELATELAKEQAKLDQLVDRQIEQAAIPHTAE